MKSGKFLNVEAGVYASNYVLIPLKSGKFLNPMVLLPEPLTTVLIPLKSGKFLNPKPFICMTGYIGLNPFEVREVSKLLSK